MEESKEPVLNGSGDRIVTEQIIAGIFDRSSKIRILRSAVHGVLSHCAEFIRNACKQSETPKEFQIILPHLANPDVRIRAVAAGKNPDEVLARLAHWHEVYAKLGAELAPKHSVEIRTTDQPHRYHAIISDSEGFAGFAWQHKASLTTSSFDIRRDSPFQEWLLRALHEDFERIWEMSHPYHAGDNKKMITRGGIKSSTYEVLAEFGRATPNVIATLRFIKRGFPDANGNGATKEHVATHFDIDTSFANKRLLDMERAGFLYKLSGNGNEFHGRLITKCGELILREWEQKHGSDERNR